MICRPTDIPNLPQHLTDELAWEMIKDTELCVNCIAMVSYNASVWVRAQWSDASEQLNQPIASTQMLAAMLWAVKWGARVTVEQTFVEVKAAVTYRGSRLCIPCFRSIFVVVSGVGNGGSFRNAWGGKTR